MEKIYLQSQISTSEDLINVLQQINIKSKKTLHEINKIYAHNKKEDTQKRNNK